jgi:hypothetical protein
MAALIFGRPLQIERSGMSFLFASLTHPAEPGGPPAFNFLNQILGYHCITVAIGFTERQRNERDIEVSDAPIRPMDAGC